ncbi:MAG: hypothetical protein ACHQQ3_06940 [Gemmatimonadales bacterium]
MLDAVIGWLDRVGPLVFWTCAIALATLDSAAVAMVMRTRSRELVNRWTSTVLAANLLLAGVGVGVPGAMYVAKVALRAVAPAASSLTIAKDPGDTKR